MHTQKAAMATHSSTLAWKIPWMEEPGGLQSMRSRRVRHDWVTSLSLFTFTHWRRKWQPTPVFLPGESQGWRSLVGCRLWGRTESDMTKATYRILGQNKRRLSVIECKLIIIKIYISKYLLWSKWDFYTFLKIHLRFLKIWHASNPSRVYCAF